MPRRARVAHDHQDYLTPDDLRRVLGACGVRDRALFYLMLEAGLRVSEPGLLLRDDWRTARRELYARRVKGSISATRPVSDALHALLLAWIAERPASKWLFPGADPSGPRGISDEGARSAWKTACARAGLSPRAAYPHILKHTRCTLLRAGGATREAIGEAVGHRMLTSTDRYFKVTPEARAQVASATDAIAAAVLGQR